MKGHPHIRIIGQSRFPEKPAERIAAEKEMGIVMNATYFAASKPLQFPNLGKVDDSDLSDKVTFADIIPGSVVYAGEHIQVTVPVNMYGEPVNPRYDKGCIMHPFTIRDDVPQGFSMKGKELRKRPINTAIGESPLPIPETYDQLERTPGLQEKINKYLANCPEHNDRTLTMERTVSVVIPEGTGLEVEWVSSPDENESGKYIVEVKGLPKVGILKDQLATQTSMNPFNDEYFNLDTSENPLADF